MVEKVDSQIFRLGNSISVDMDCEKIINGAQIFNILSLDKYENVLLSIFQLLCGF